MPEIAPAPPAPTPTPAPAPAPAPTPAPAPPSPSPAPAPAAGGDDPFAAMDARIAERRKAAAPPDPKPGEPKPGDPKPGDKAPEPAQAPGREEPKHLRAQLNKLNADLKARQDTITTLESKIKDSEARGKDTTALAEQLAEREKQLEAKESEIRALRQEASPEFKEKWDKPFNQTADFAKRQIEQLTVNDENGNPARNATWEDFTNLYRMPLNKATMAAKEMFGDAAQIVINSLTELQRLDFQRSQALQEERSKWSEREKSDMATRAREREAAQTMWTHVNKDLADKYPERYQPDPEDKEGNEVLEEGFRLVDSRHNAASMTLQQRIMLDANIRLRAAGFGRMELRAHRLTEENASLKEKIAELENSEPGKPTKRTSGGEAPAPKSWRDDLNDHMKK